MSPLTLRLPHQLLPVAISTRTFCCVTTTRRRWLCTSSFHVIGEIFDSVYNLGSLTAEPLSNVQTISVPPGGAAAVDFKVEVPGDYILVDHALSRAARGLVGTLTVEGPEQPVIFREGGEDVVGMQME